MESKSPTTGQTGSDDSSDRLPRAYLARVPFPAGSKVSAVLVPRSMGFLAVRLIVDDHPVVGVAVTFFERDADGQKADVLGEPIPSDENGIARLPRVVPTGTYACEVEGQEGWAVIHSVDRLRDAFDLPLPIAGETIE